MVNNRVAQNFNLKLTGIYLLISCLSSINLTSCQQNKTALPNVLLIVADDLGYEKLGSYGNLDSITPHLDQLAKKGAQFDRAYASPVCTPSRMSVYTGTYPTTHQYTSVIPVHKGKKDKVDFSKWLTTAQLLRKEGYATAVTGKWQMGGLEFYPDHCKTAGFDSWCIWQIWHDDQKTTRYYDPTYNEEGTILKTSSEDFGPDLLHQYVIRKMAEAKTNDRPFFIQHNMVLPHVPIVPTPEDQLRGDTASLDRMIRYLDGKVGQLVEAVDSLGINEETIIIFVGDNGTQSESSRSITTGEVSGGKWQLNDAGIHVPLIVHWPGKVKAGNRQALIDISDLMPTLLTLAKVKSPLPKMDGISFDQVLFENTTGNRAWVTAAIGDEFVVFDGEWRLHSKAEKLVDCRDLPRETIVTMMDSTAVAAKSRLKAVLEKLRKANTDKFPMN